MRQGEKNAALTGVAVAPPGARCMSVATGGDWKLAVIQYTPVESTASVLTFI